MTRIAPTFVDPPGQSEKEENAIRHFNFSNEMDKSRFESGDV
jgi:hypothetical protein